MHTTTQALLAKEWIKLRRGVWLLPLLVGFAAMDGLLVLKTISRQHGPMGLWVTLVGKEPTFFSWYALLGLCGLLLGFLQAWPECQGRRLRLLFHTPLPAERILGVMLGVGLAVLVVLNIAAHVALAGSMLVFHLPWDVIRPVLLAVAPWSALSLTIYLCTVAFFASTGLPMKLLVVACAYTMWSLLGDPWGYGAFAPSLWAYFAMVPLLCLLALYALLRFMGDPQARPLFTLARTVALLLVVSGLCTFLPQQFWRVAMPERVRQGMFYSPVLGQFVQSSTALGRAIGPVGAGSTAYALEDGQSITQREYAQALPFLYAEDLAKWGAFPATVGGQPLTPLQARSGWQYQNFNPRAWNAPGPMLHMLLEAEPHGARLELAPDVFRLARGNMGIEFLRPADGSVDRDKSARFTQALAGAGFAFPVAALGGNPDPRKEYDVGYLLVDAAGTLFRMQMVHGAPVCLNSGQNVPGRVRAVLVNEHRRRESFGVVVTDTALHMVMMPDMALRELPVPWFNADTTRATLWSDLVCKSVITSDLDRPREGSRGLALDPEFRQVRTFDQAPDAESLRIMDQRRTLASALFPLRWVQSSPGSSYAHLRPEWAVDAPLAGALGVLGALAGYVLWRRRRGAAVSVWDAVLMVYGPLALAVVVLDGWGRPQAPAASRK